jgi:hypothetical protein
MVQKYITDVLCVGLILKFIFGLTEHMKSTDTFLFKRRNDDGGGDDNNSKKSLLLLINNNNYIAVTC